jgi:hypothetical protein
VAVVKPARHRVRKAARRRQHMVVTANRNRLHGVSNYQQLVEELGL